MPAILNVNGHVGPVGKAAEYKQKRCINFAKRGVVALNLEWIGYGELSAPENKHSYAGHLDLVGANAVGLSIWQCVRASIISTLFPTLTVDGLE